MHTPAATRHRPPYGLAFPLAELVFVRDWAAQRGLTMTILLDQVLDGAEFEELLLLRGASAGRRALTIWRTAGSVIAQAAGNQPRAFTAVQPALSHFLGLLEQPAPCHRPGLVTGTLARLWQRVAGSAAQCRIQV